MTLPSKRSTEPSTSEVASLPEHPNPYHIARLALQLDDDPAAPNCDEHLHQCDRCRRIYTRLYHFIDRHPAIRSCPEPRARVLSEVVAGIADDETKLLIQLHCVDCSRCAGMAVFMLQVMAGAPEHRGEWSDEEIGWDPRDD